MLRKFFGRKTIILGRAIPLTAILTAVAAVGALAWISILIFTQAYQINSMAAPPDPAGTFLNGNWGCEVVSGPGTSNGNCLDNSLLTYRANIAPIWNGVNETTVLTVHNAWQNSDTKGHVVDVDLSALDPAIVVDASQFPATVAAGTTSPQLYLTFDLTNIAPSTAYNFDVVFSVERLP